MKTVRVNLGERSYDIHIGEDLISRAGSFIAEAARPTKAIIVTDEHVGDLYEGPVRASIDGAKIPCASVTVPAGESSKSLDTAERLYDDFAERQIDRASVVVALGGGVVGDLAGFVAAT